MTSAKARVMPFAATIEACPFLKPYAHHSIKPKINAIYIIRDMPDASRVFIMLITCGINEAVVKNPATSPNISIDEALINDNYSVMGIKIPSIFYI